jgi:nucleoid DNA-binding protein
MREIPLNICLACGGNWFREVDCYRFLREESVGSFWPGWPDLVGRISPGPMTLLVCLCGTPLAPSIGGVRGGRTPNVELLQFLDSLEQCREWLVHQHDRELLLAAAEEHLAKAKSRQDLADPVTDLERLAGRRIARLTSSRNSPRGRYWEPPKRKPASGDVLTLDTLVIALQKIGFTAREAKPVVKVIFESMTNWLKDGGRVETPLGVFEIVYTKLRERTLFRLGQPRKMYTKSKKVVFRPSKELLAACNRPKLGPQ